MKYLGVDGVRRCRQHKPGYLLNNSNITATLWVTGLPKCCLYKQNSTGLAKLPCLTPSSPTKTRKYYIPHDWESNIKVHYRSKSHNMSGHIAIKKYTKQYYIYTIAYCSLLNALLASRNEQKIVLRLFSIRPKLMFILKTIPFSTVISRASALKTKLMWNRKREGIMCDYVVTWWKNIEFNVVTTAGSRCDMWRMTWYSCFITPYSAAADALSEQVQYNALRDVNES